jgi:hypothetical protein
MGLGNKPKSGEMKRGHRHTLVRLSWQEEASKKKSKNAYSSKASALLVFVCGQAWRGVPMTHRLAGVVSGR